MTILIEAANLDWNGDTVSPNGAVGGSGIVNWLTGVIQRIRDFLDVDLEKWEMEGEDEVYLPTGGCCGF